MNKGSIWRKWDFHLHTPCSILNNGYGDSSKDETWDNYIEQIEKVAKEKHISAIGITDYFMIEGYKKVEEYKEKGRLEDIFIFPNIEFRADKIITVKKEGKTTVTKRINFHILFSPDVDINTIREHFLDDIEFIYEEDTFSSGQKRKLKISNIAEFGKTLKSQHKKFKDMSDLFVGCMNAVVDPNAVKEILEKNDKFKGKYLICLAEDHTSLMGWDSAAHGTRKQLLQMSHCVFSSNKKTRDFCLATGKNVNEHLAEFKSLKPCIWGCDGHDYKDRFLIPEKNQEGKINFCWVKSDLTWNGLMQILYEPRQRIRIQEDNPETQKSIHTLDKIKIEETEINAGLKIKKTDIDLNHNLISVIGGRGSGKTAILDLIASCFKEGEKLEQLDSSFYKRLYGKKTSNKPITVKLSTKSKKDVISKKIGEEKKIIDEADIRYITQKHFEGLSSDSQQLSKYVFDIIFEKSPDELEQYYTKKESIKNKEKEIEKINLSIQQLLNEINEISVLNEEKKKKEGDKKDCEERIKEIEDKEKIDEKLDEVAKKLKEKRDERKDLESAKTRLETIKTSMEQIHNFNSLVEGFNDEFSEKLKIGKLDMFDIGLFEKISSSIKTNEETILKKIEEISKEIEEINKEFKSFEETHKTISELKKKLITINEDIEKIDKKIEEMKEKEKEIKSLQNNIFDITKEIIKGHIELSDFLNKHIKKIEQGKNELLKNLDFCIVLEIDNSSFCDKINEHVNNQTISRRELSLNIEREIIKPLNDIINDSKDEYDKLKEGYEKVHEIIEDKLKKKVKYAEVNNSLFEIPINTKINISLDKIPLESLSMGQRAIVLMQTILAYDDKPLLIDQPEEDLDNKYIYEQLVSALRKAKEKRQVIIASHNANLVVNTDSEQIIIADYKDGEISYTVGTIENLDTQGKIKSILEGGKEAFEKRKEKYGYKF
ncbi:hypothetical protein GOV04_01490 [Candidatus Woesearchaeota archaeon]|nr:hypothetical protein [Candidatus Woesearchaeota archaeon]